VNCPTCGQFMRRAKTVENAFVCGHERLLRARGRRWSEAIRKMQETGGLPPMPEASFPFATFVREVGS